MLLSVVIAVEDRELEGRLARALSRADTVVDIVDSGRILKRVVERPATRQSTSERSSTR